MRPRGRNSFCGAYSAGHPFEVVGVEFPLQLAEFLGFLVTSVIEDGLLELLELIEKFLRPDVHLLKLLQLLLRVMLLFQPSIDDLVAIAQLAPRARMNHHLLGRLVHRQQLAQVNECFFTSFIAGRAQHIVEHVRNQVVLSLEELDDVISRLNKSFDHGDNLPVNWIGSGADGLRATPKDLPAVAVIQPFGSSAATRSPSGARRWASIAELQTQLDAFVDAYNHRRPHRSLPHQATPATVYTARPKADPANRTDTHNRVRTDRIDQAGVITVRVAGRLHHIGVGRTYTGTRVLILIQDLHIRIINAATGELLRELTLDPTKNYQPTSAPKGPKRKKFRT